jgi:hypothetical protein
MSERTQKVVYAAIDALNEQLSDGQKLEKNPGTVLLGQGGHLDSIGYINLVVFLEEECKEQSGIDVSLAESSPADGDPFETVGSLIDHLDRLLSNKFSART